MNTPAITILEHEPSEYVSTSFNEVVTCRLGDGSVRKLLLKRGRNNFDSYGHRGGVPHEGQVYRSVLEPLGTSAPRLHSMDLNPETGEATILIDYIDDALRLSKAELGALPAAARWIGELHRLNESRVADLTGTLPFYTREYYLGWCQRTLGFARDLDFDWLPTVVRYFEASLDELLEPPVTVVHGEYYGKNILVRDRVIIPVDWESAAIAAGEVDIASLTEGWPEEDKQICQKAYQEARWPEGPPPEFERRVRLASLYMLFRWLGDRPEWVTGEDADWQFQELKRLAQNVGAFE